MIRIEYSSCCDTDAFARSKSVEICFFFVVQAFAFKFDCSEGTNLIFTLCISRFFFQDRALRSNEWTEESGDEINCFSFCFMYENERSGKKKNFIHFLSVSSFPSKYDLSGGWKGREQKCVLFLPFFVFLCFQNGSLKWTMKNRNSGLSIAFRAEKIEDIDCKPWKCFWLEANETKTIKQIRRRWWWRWRWGGGGRRLLENLELNGGRRRRSEGKTENYPCC